MKSIFYALPIAVLSTQLHAAVFTVISSADSGPGTLRAAIALADANPGVDTIDFDPSLNGSVISLTTAELVIDDPDLLTIDASALADGITISGSSARRVIRINGTSDVTMMNITVANGLEASSGGGILLAGGNLAMSDCTISNCYADGSGGGLYLFVNVSATLDRCKIVNNGANASTGIGGGVFVGGASDPIFRSCIVSGNRAAVGGGLLITNSSPSLFNCTIQGNSGQGILNDETATPTDPILKNTIVWGNSPVQITNTGGASPVISNSMIQGASGGNTPDFANPISAALAPHSGGDLRLLETSDALDIGNSTIPSDIGTLDIAGAARVQGIEVDLGAYEGCFATFTALHPSLVATEDDNDNGVSNFEEYAMGFDPTSSSNGVVYPVASKSGAFSILTVNQRANALDLNHILQTSTLPTSGWGSMVEGVHYSLITTTSPTAKRNQLELRLVDGDSWRFYRQGFQTP